MIYMNVIWTGVSLIYSLYHVFSTLGAGEHEAGIRHVVSQIHMSPAAEDSSSLQRDVGFYGDGIGANHWPIGSTLTLDLPTFSISGKQQEQTNKKGNIWFT